MARAKNIQTNSQPKHTFITMRRLGKDPLKHLIRAARLSISGATEEQINIFERIIEQGRITEDDVWALANTGTDTSNLG